LRTAGYVVSDGQYPNARSYDVGVKTTFAVQLAPAATDVQLLVWLKSPLIVIPVIVSAAPPVFEIVTTCGAELLPVLRLAKVRVAGVMLTAGAIPVPVKATVCRPPDALSATDKIPPRFLRRSA